MKCIYAYQDNTVTPLITSENFLRIREFQNFIHVCSDITRLLTLSMHPLPAKLTQYKELCFPGKSPLKPREIACLHFVSTVMGEYKMENTDNVEMQKYCY